MFLFDVVKQLNEYLVAAVVYLASLFCEKRHHLLDCLRIEGFVIDLCEPAAGNAVDYFFVSDGKHSPRSSGLQALQIEPVAALVGLRVRRRLQELLRSRPYLLCLFPKTL